MISPTVDTLFLLGHAGPLARLIAGFMTFVHAFLLLWAPATMSSTRLRGWSRGRRHRGRRGDAESVANHCLITERAAGALATAYHTWLCWQWWTGALGRGDAKKDEFIIYLSLIGYVRAIYHWPPQGALVGQI